MARTVKCFPPNVGSKASALVHNSPVSQMSESKGGPDIINNVRVFWFNTRPLSATRSVKNRIGPQLQCVMQPQEVDSDRKIISALRQYLMSHCNEDLQSRSSFCTVFEGQSGFPGSNAEETYIHHCLQDVGFAAKCHLLMK